MKRLEGKVILVTGAGRGFGKYMTLAFASEGAKVIAVARSVNELTTIKESIYVKGGNCVIFPTDLLKFDDMTRLRDFVEKQYGRLDTLVNCAADSPWKLFEDMTIEEWDTTISVNLRAPFILSKLFLPMMKMQGKGSIINISSGSAQIGFLAETGYCPSKFGLEGLTQCLAMELHQYNIAVNSLGVAAPESKILKPSKITLSEESKIPEEIRSKYADDNSMVEAFSEAWSFIALQDAHGVTGQRFGIRQLAEYLKVNGWDVALANWKNKLTKAVYVSYDLPEKIVYDTPLKEKLGLLSQKEYYFKK
jgi:NAD(P)-dependent dehydrogenase (short-subunit alcohol dehydrogenase family)